MVYDKLDGGRNQIRLLHILKEPRQEPDGILCCTLKTVSLLDVTPSYAALFPDHLYNKRRQDILAEWIKFNSSSTVIKKFNLLRVPYDSRCRFGW